MPMTESASPSKVECALREQMRALLTQRPTPPFPSVHAWARSHRTSTRIVMRALHALRDEGLVDVRRGKRPTLPSPPVPPESQLAQSPSARVYRSIAQALEEGRYPAGSRLPKHRFFMVEQNVSYNTVLRALRQLERHHLVHRSGRHYVAGPSARTAMHTHGTGPVILMVQAFEEWWQETLANDWVSPFSRAFMHEVNLAGTQVVPVFLTEPRSAFLIHGETAIADYARSLGTRYRGTLIMGQSWDFVNRHGRTVSEIIRRFAALARPVAWFDFIDEPRQSNATFDRDAYRSLTCEPRARRLFSRCHHDHEQALQFALQTLYEFGHRCVGIPWFSDEADSLISVRVEALARLAGQWPGLSVVVEPSEGNPFTVGQPDASRVPPAFTTQIRKLVDRGATALIAVTDTRARAYYVWLRTMGYDIPGALSLLSFDASPRQLYPWQISSVDFGFGYLAYAAYHLLMGDVPIQRTDCAVPARPRLNHSGSLGAPR